MLVVTHSNSTVTALEPLDAEKENVGIKALQYKELTTVNHSVRPFFHSMTCSIIQSDVNSRP